MTTLAALVLQTSAITDTGFAGRACVKALRLLLEPEHVRVTLGET
jgi:hypothetical protein